MTAPRNVLVAVDFEPTSMAALKSAGEIARAFDAKLHVLHVLHLPAVQNIAAVPLAIEREAERNAQRRLIASTEGIPCISELLVRPGEAGAVIPEVAKELGADLVIVGAHKRRGLRRLLGSVAKAVAQRSPCAVLVHTERATPSSSAKTTETA